MDTPSTSPVDPLLDTVILGKYQVTGRIARGGMSRIYRAEQLPLGRVVALKVLVPPRHVDEQDGTFKQRFLQEAATCARLRHPNTVTVFDYGSLDDGSLYMVLEYIDGATLRSELRSNGPMTVERTLRIAWEITRSLGEAHPMGIVHRDLKSSNVMLMRTPEGEAVKILDFGIAKVLESSGTGMTMENQIVGSPGYMSPEQIVGGAIDGRADIYALGVLMFEMLTGRHPYRESTPVQTLMAHMRDPIPDLRAIVPGIPDDIVAVVEACLAKAADDRPATVLELRQMIEGCQDITNLTTGSMMRSGVLSRPKPKKRRAAPLVGAAVLLGAISLVAAIGLWYSRQAPQPGPAPEVVAVRPPVKLTIRSEPAGAEVWEGNRLHGRTPLDLDHPVDAPERSFDLRMDGFETVRRVQGASEVDVEIVASLEPLPIPEPTPIQVAAPTSKPTPRPRPSAPPKPQSDPAEDEGLFLER